MNKKKKSLSNDSERCYCSLLSLAKLRAIKYCCADAKEGKTCVTPQFCTCDFHWEKFVRRNKNNCKGKCKILD